MSPHKFSLCKQQSASLPRRADFARPACSSPLRRADFARFALSVTGFARWWQKSKAFCEQAPNGSASVFIARPVLHYPAGLTSLASLSQSRASPDDGRNQKPFVSKLPTAFDFCHRPAHCLRGHYITFLGGLL